MKYWLTLKKDKNAKTCFFESLFVSRRSIILGLWRFFSFSSLAVNSYKRNPKESCVSLRGGGGLMTGVNLRFHCCKCNNVYRLNYVTCNQSWIKLILATNKKRRGSDVDDVIHYELRLQRACD